MICPAGPRVIVCGSRDWTDPEPIRQALRRVHPSLLIHGGSLGTDAIAGQIARELGILVRAHPADWKRFGRGAGPLRNQRMLEAEKPDLVIAFSTRSPLTPGTADMVARARAAGVPVEVHIAEVPDRGPIANSLTGAERHGKSAAGQPELSPPSAALHYPLHEAINSHAGRHQP
ncbi:MAG: SLOG family protein [Candidatus Dormibacteraceae bacterium]